MKTNYAQVFYILLVFLLITSFTTASDGDRSVFYQKCVNKCQAANCTAEGEYKPDITADLDVYSKFLWSCIEECKYNCMWKTVQGFQEQGYSIPKFHGKWPFKRIFGVQEPASAFASVLNLICHLYMQLEISRQIPIRAMPAVLLWHIFILIMVNGWLWSAVFHTRDTPFTEFMDYACALSMIKALYFAGVLRAFNRKRKFAAIILLPSLPYYFSHLVYLYSGRIDYGYNLLVNGIFAAAGMVIWLVWAGFQYLAGKYYTWRMIAFIILSALSMSLEIFDFPPKWGWDAHSLWHLSTAALPILFYRFVIEDLIFLQKNKFDLNMYTRISEANKNHKRS